MDMIQCLIEVDSSAPVIVNAIANCLMGHYTNNGSIQLNDITPGSIGYETLTLVEKLLKATFEAVYI